MTAGERTSGAAEHGTVAVCIVTYRREELLRELLRALEGQRFSGRAPVLRVVVVDNDPAGSARAVCAAAGAALSLRYALETERGIPQARNRAVALGLEAAELVAFLDDDERPEPGWLDALLRARATYGADVVTGPVVRELPPAAPAWIQKSRFFDLPRRPTGTRVRQAGTGNVLVAADVFRAFTPPFPIELRFSGGEDLLFFRRVSATGRSIVWADDALVHERVEPERLSARFILGRSFANGAVHARIERALGAGAGGRPARVAVQALGAVARGVLLFPLGLVQGKRGAVRGLWHLARAAGLCAGLLGHAPEPYRARR